MNILFLTMNNFEKISEHSVYTDLIRALLKRCNDITVLSPIEKKHGISTNMHDDMGVRVIKVRTGNLFNVGMIEKFISRAGICSRYKKALKKYCNNTKFDLVLFTTPPTTLSPVVRRIKKCGAYAYLMLKDIFPQNAVDLGLIRQTGFAFRFLRILEKRTYKVADTIGCMSPANVDFLKNQDPWIDAQRITICPNAIEVRDECFSRDERQQILNKYEIPSNKILFVYGGGLGKPQGLDFLVESVKALKDDKDIFFLVIGSGVYFDSLKMLEFEYPGIIKVLKWLPSEEYENIVKSSDVGLVFLSHCFKVPNFPSRTLHYMQARIPILAATDANTDIGRIVEKNNFGYWCESNDVNSFVDKIQMMKNGVQRKEMGMNAYNYLLNHYSVDVVADKIIERVERANNIK